MTSEEEYTLAGQVASRKKLEGNPTLSREQFRGHFIAVQNDGHQPASKCSSNQESSAHYLADLNLARDPSFGDHSVPLAYFNFCQQVAVRSWVFRGIPQGGRAGKREKFLLQSQDYELSSERPLPRVSICRRGSARANPESGS
jgi:hypothetical protein